jgi:choice-of-anchor B domain-containing protein
MNMYKILTGLFVFFFLSSWGQGDSFNARLTAHLPNAENSSDIWGFEKDSVYYAVMGSFTKTQIYSLEDPANPLLLYEAEGTRSIWRDIKYYNNHLYVTADQGRDGILIIDVSGAPDNISHSFYKPDITIDTVPRPLQKCHNIYIDENGMAYLAGCNVGRGGVLIFDLNEDPKAPVYKGAADLQYSHDAFTRGDTLYTSEIYQGNLGIYDVSDKSQPRLLALQQTSRLFTHNAWPSDDGKYVFTTDERAGAYVDAFDISDLSNIKFLDRFRPLERETDGVIPHNTHYHKGYLVTSWYTDGVRIVDAHKPDNLVEIAYFDTWEDPLDCHRNFFGCWGAFPYTDSDYLYASDINNGLFIIEVDYKRAAYLEGKVTDVQGQNINNVRVEILSDQINRKFSNPSGEYKTGLANDGLHTVRFSHPEFDTYETEVELVRGEVILLDVQLTARSNENMEVTIKNKEEEIISIPVKLVQGSESSLRTTSQGQPSIFDVLSGTYDIHMGLWGYENIFLENVEVVSGEDNKIDRVISSAYQDYFELDSGWKVESSQTNKGIWTRAIPREIKTLGSVSRPGTDSEDPGQWAYITGNGAPGAACDGLVSGETSLISPEMDLSSYNFPRLNFDIWFHKGNNPDSPDLLEVLINNGIDSVVIATFSENTSEWLQVRDIDISGFIELTEQMTLTLKASSYDTEYPVTAGFDNFFISDTPTSADNPVSENKIFVFPNPATDYVTIRKKSDYTTAVDIMISDVFGQSMYKGSFSEKTVSIDINSWPSGMYIIQTGQNQPVRIVKH